VTGSRWLVMGLLAGIAGGCGPGDPATPISNDTFIEVQVALRTAMGPVELDSATRADILAHHGVSEADLRAYVRSYRDRPERLQPVYDAIAQRLEPPLPAPDSIPADTSTAEAMLDDSIVEPEITDTVHPSLPGATERGIHSRPAVVDGELEVRPRRGGEAGTPARRERRPLPIPEPM
jgi:hypothetical protein